MYEELEQKIKERARWLGSQLADVEDSIAEKEPDEAKPKGYRRFINDARARLDEIDKIEKIINDLKKVR